MTTSAYQVSQTGALGALQDVAAKRTADVLEIKDIAYRVGEAYTVMADAIINRDLNATHKELAELKQSADQDIQKVLELVDTAEEQALAKVFSNQYRNYLDLFEKQMLPILEKSSAQHGAVAAADEQKIRELDGEIDALRIATQTPLGEINKSLTEENRTADQLFDETRQAMINTLLLISLSTMVIAVFIAFLITRSITRPLITAVTVSELIASGDLTIDIEANTLDETGQLLNTMKMMATQLKAIVGEVNQATSAVNLSASEIAQGSADLSQRTEEQASALEETASSMEELTSTVKQSADNAGQANQLAGAARTQAEQGGQVVDQAIAAMSAINQSSRKIADIISVIDEIAFQTNLLALNAAVEAARAGEQGRGFAVIAGEVRKLAQRSADAAKEIKALITDSVSKVQDGSQLVERSGQTLQEIVGAVKKVSDIVAEIAAATREQASGIEQVNKAILVERSGQTLQEIVGAVKKVSDIVAEIAAATREQASGIEQVNKAILQMDQATQQNAALVEETASASQAMGDQATELQKLMGFFKLKTQAPIPPQAAAGPAPRRETMSARAAPRPVTSVKSAATKPRPGTKHTVRSAPVERKPTTTTLSTAEAWEEF